MCVDRSFTIRKKNPSAGTITRRVVVPFRDISILCSRFVAVVVGVSRAATTNTTGSAHKMYGIVSLYSGGFKC